MQGLSPVQHAIDAFKEFIDRTKSSFIFDTLDEKKAWTTFESASTNTEVRSRMVWGHVTGGGDLVIVPSNYLLFFHESLRRASPMWRRCCARMCQSRFRRL